MSQESIRLVIEGPVAAIVLERPGKANALTHAMWTAIPSLVAEAEGHEGARILVIRSAAAGVFSAGADLEEVKRSAGNAGHAAALHAAFCAACAAIRESFLPSVAMIEGACFGGGCGLAFACDFRIAATNAVFAVTPAKMGLIYPLAEVKALAGLAGTSRAKELLFTARAVKAEEAFAMGLVNAVHPPGRMTEAAGDFCRAIAAASVVSARGHKRIFELIASGCHADTEETAALFREAAAGPDHAEGVSAFLEKRAPRF